MNSRTLIRMEPNLSPDVHTAAGTAGGFILVLLTQLNSTDMFRSAVLALIGGVVSFGVSMGLKLLVRYLKKH